MKYINKMKKLNLIEKLVFDTKLIGGSKEEK